jgi:hypothetical protein
VIIYTQYTGVLILMKSICQQFNMDVNAGSVGAILQAFKTRTNCSARCVWVTSLVLASKTMLHSRNDPHLV